MTRTGGDPQQIAIACSVAAVQVRAGRAASRPEHQAASRPDHNSISARRGKFAQAARAGESYDAGLYQMLGCAGLTRLVAQSTYRVPVTACELGKLRASLPCPALPCPALPAAQLRLSTDSAVAGGPDLQDTGCGRLHSGSPDHLHPGSASSDTHRGHARFRQHFPRCNFGITWRGRGRSHRRQQVRGSERGWRC